MDQDFLGIQYKLTIDILFLFCRHINELFWIWVFLFSKYISVWKYFCLLLKYEKWGKNLSGIHYYKNSWKKTIKGCILFLEKYRKVIKQTFFKPFTEPNN